MRAYTWAISCGRRIRRTHRDGRAAAAGPGSGRARLLRQYLDERRRHVLRVGVQHPQPGQLGRAGEDGAHQPREGIPLAAIATVRGGVLSDEHRLAHTPRRQLACLANDIRRGFAALPPLDEGNGTERAGRITAVGDLDVGRRADRAAPRYRRHQGIGPATEDRRRRLHIVQAFDEGDDLGPRLRAQYGIDLGHVAAHRVAVALRETAHRHQALPPTLPRRQGAQLPVGFGASIKPRVHMVTSARRAVSTGVWPSRRSSSAIISESTVFMGSQVTR